VIFSRCKTTTGTAKFGADESGGYGVRGAPVEHIYTGNPLEKVRNRSSYIFLICLVKK